MLLLYPAPINHAKAKGFTLVELLAVIIVLGILAVAALPKFVSLSSEARTEAIRQLSVSTKTANDFVNIKSKMPSFASEDASSNGRITDVDINGDGQLDLRLIWGYLDNEDLAERVEFSDDFLMMCEGNCKGGAGVNLPGAQNSYIGYDLDDDGDVRNDNCYFQYTQAQAQGAKPEYQLISNGC